MTTTDAANPTMSEPHDQPEKLYRFEHSQVRFFIWEVNASSEEEAEERLFDPEHSRCIKEWSKADEIELLTVEDGDV